jgi:hypothetical protein
LSEDINSIIVYPGELKGDFFMTGRISFLLMLGLVTGSSAVQVKTDSVPADLVILKFSWSQHLNRPNWDRDLYRTANEAARDERNEREAKRRPTPRPKEVLTLPEVMPDQAATATKGFQYRVTIKNSGRKTIRVIEWEYVFLQPETEKVEMRHPFMSRKKIEPGETKELLQFSTAPPTPVIRSGGEATPSFVERVIITRIEYGDGSLWQRP